MYATVIVIQHTTRPSVKEWEVNDVGEKGKEEEEGEEEMGVRVPRKVVNPSESTQEEREEHEKSHLPYRNRCADCAKARGVGITHAKSSEEGKMV